jgi:hypothetical protein
MDDRLGDDLLIGAKPIAEFLGVNARKIFYWGETGHLPLFKIGSQWAGKKSTLIRHFEKLENEKVA